MNDRLPLPINREAFLRALTVTVPSDGALPYEVVTEGGSSGRLSENTPGQLRAGRLLGPVGPVVGRRQRPVRGAPLEPGHHPFDRVGLAHQVVVERGLLALHVGGRQARALPEQTFRQRDRERCLRADLARAWFPGSGPVLPLPYTHPADRY